MATIDTDKLNALVGKMLGDLGGAFSGTDDAHRLPAGPVRGPAPRWRQRRHRARGAHRPGRTATCANGRWRRRPTATSPSSADHDRFSLTPEQAMVFAVKDSPVYLEGAFDLAAAMIEGQPKVEAAFRNGGGVAWGDSSGCLFCAVGAFFRPGYVNSIVQSWLPALDGMLPRLKAGAKVADVGCGVGFSTLLMAKAFPNSSFVGYDFHASLHRAGQRARAGPRSWPTASRFVTAGPRRSPSATSTSSPCSTACTTWAIRAAAPGTCASC